MIFELSKKALVVQSNRLIEAKYRLSVEEQKIIKVLISQIQRDDKDFQEYVFRIQDLADMLGMNHSNTYGVLRGITKKLITRVLEFYNPENNTLLQTAWLSSAQYKVGQGIVSMCFDPKLKPLLLQLKSYFTKYELGRIMQFKGQYTIRFFELRKSFLGKNMAEVTFSLKELRETLGLQKTEYTQFFDFKKRVIEPARLELLEKAGSAFDWEPIRQGRGGRITAVRFVFHPSDENSEKEDVSAESETVAPADTAAQLPMEWEEPPSTETPEIVVLLIERGVTPAVAQELARKHAEGYLREKIAIVDVNPEYVQNKAGFLITAIQKDWKDARQEEQKRQEEARKLEREKKQREARLRSIKDNFSLYRKNKVLQGYEQLSESVRQQFREEFLGGASAILRKRYLDKPEFGFEDPYYRGFLMQHKIASPSLEAYLRQNNTILTPEEIAFVEGREGTVRPSTSTI